MSNAAISNRGGFYERDENEWYIEPRFCTRALLKAERFFGMVLDPACGQGHIVRECHAAGVNAIGSDIVQRVDRDLIPHFYKSDFLTDQQKSVANIICNPPFFRAKGTEAFIRRALDVARNKVAIFADIKFLAGQDRATALYRELPPDRVYIITPRPSCPPGWALADGAEASGGTADWIWLVWDKTLPGAMRGQTRLTFLHDEEEATRRKGRKASKELTIIDDRQNAA